MKLGANVVGESQGSLFGHWPTPMKLMLACLIFGLVAQFSHSWLVPPEEGRSWGLRGYTADYLDGDGNQISWISHGVNLDDCIRYAEEREDLEPASHCAAEFTVYRAGVLTSFLLAMGSVSALCCLVIESRQPSDLWRSRSKNLARIAGGATLLAPFVWYLWGRLVPVISDYYALPFGDGYMQIGYGFKLAVVGGLLGLLSTRQIDEKWAEKLGALRERNDLAYAKIAVVVITLSMFMPYLVVGVGISGGSMADITIEYSFALVVQLIHDLLPDDSALHWVLLPIHDLLIGPYYGIGFSIPSLEWGSLSEAPAGLVALSLLVLLSPLFFMVSALCVGYSMYTKGTVPKGIGEVHLIYFFSILIILVGSSSYDYLFGEFFYSLGIFIPGSSLSGAFIGFGFWVGGLAGFGFIYRPPPLSPPDVVSSNAVYQHYLRQLIAQGYDEATAKKYAKEYEENHTKQQ